MAWESKGCTLPPSSLPLLVPPVRLMSAFLWQIVHQHNVLQYDKLVDFISLVTEVVPEILSPGQRAQLILGLRGRLVLELCRGDGVGNLQSIQSHLDKIHNCSSELSSNAQNMSDVLKTSYTNFASLVQTLLYVPFEKDYFFQEVFPVNYGSDYDQRLEQMVSVFLTRLEQLLPIPDLSQTSAWLTEMTSVAEDLGQNLSEPFALKSLLLHHRQLGTIGTAPADSEDEELLTVPILPFHTGEVKFTEVYIQGEDYDSEENALDLKNLTAEDSSPSSELNADEWLPKMKSGSLSRSFICPLCSFVHHIKRKVQEHIQSEHQLSSSATEQQIARKDKAQQKRQSSDGEEIKEQGQTSRRGNPAPKDESETKKTRKQKRENIRRTETGGLEDRRFLSSKTVNKKITKGETKCVKCEKVFEHPNQLKTHMKLHTFKHQCSQCEKGFISSSGYYQHQRLHKKGRIFTCSQCNKGFLCNYSLKQHERLHQGPSHLCTICGKRFSGAGIQRHLQMHRGEKNYLCTTCGKSFLSSGELLLHTRSHTGELPYTCTQCGKGFSCKSHLTVHMRSHTGERPYMCSECPKRFLTLNCLKRHTLSHNGVKPFKCPSCEREFSQQGNLKRHLATHKHDS